MKRALAALLSTLILAPVLYPTAIHADVPINPRAFSSTASAGTSPIIAPAGASVCSITINTGGGATLTVKGASDATIGGTYATNTNFGTSGVITNPSNNTQWAGNVAAFPMGFEFTWTGNSGTLAGTITCSGASGISSASGGGQPVTQGTSPWVVNTPAPCSAATCNTTISLSGATPTPLPVTTPPPTTTVAVTGAPTPIPDSTLSPHPVQVCDRGVNGCAIINTFGGGVQTHTANTALQVNADAYFLDATRGAWIARFGGILVHSSSASATVIAHSGSTKTYISVIHISDIVGSAVAGTYTVAWGTTTTTPCDTGQQIIEQVSTPAVANDIVVPADFPSNGSLVIVPANNDVCVLGANLTSQDASFLYQQV